MSVNLEKKGEWPQHSREEDGGSRQCHGHPSRGEALTAPQKVCRSDKLKNGEK
jgi:hypothetical protein